MLILLVFYFISFSFDGLLRFFRILKLQMNFQMAQSMITIIQKSKPSILSDDNPKNIDEISDLGLDYS